MILSCLNNGNSRRASRQSGNAPRPSSGSGWFPGDHYNNQSGPPPPPYSKNSPNATGWENWRPGFWTGAVTGGLANELWNRTRTEVPRRQTAYDWERFQPRASSFGSSSSYREPAPSDNNRGEGSSNLGPMRRSTGLGGSNVR